MTKVGRVTLPSITVDQIAGALVLLTVLLGAEADAEESNQQQLPGKNIALGKSCTFSSSPNYPGCTDPGDKTQLTDGQLAKGQFKTQKGAVGWRGVRYVAITVDLGCVEPIAGVSFRTAADTAHWPALVCVLVSDDGATYRDVGDLVSLDHKIRGPWPNGYAVRRLSTAELRTRGRFVRFLAITPPGSRRLFVDELEVFRGPAELLQREPGGEPVGDMEEYFVRWRIEWSARRRFEADAAGIEQAIRSADLPDESARTRLLGRLAEANKALQSSTVRADKSFRAALPDARRADNEWPMTVLPGMVAQVWLTFHVTDLPPGQHAGTIVIKSEEIDKLGVPIHLQVYPLAFPEQTSLWLGGFSYTNGGRADGLTTQNRKQFVEHLRRHFVNAPWATASVMMNFDFSDDNSVRLDTREFDDWIDQWPDARMYFVLVGDRPLFAGAKVGTPEFDRRVGTWISAWVHHLDSKGISPDRLVLHIHDEPREGTDLRSFLALARAIRAAEPRVVIWNDPAYRQPAKAPRELFEVCDILCPNRTMWLSDGKPFQQFYLDQQRKGWALQLYSCCGPARLFDPYGYYRLQAWHCWQIGATGEYFYTFQNNDRSSSWNPYLARFVPSTPLFLDDETVVACKQMEAVREGVEDYETLAMLRKAVDRAKAAGRSGPAVTEAETLLKTAAQEVLDAPGATPGAGAPRGATNKYLSLWHDPKDCTKADAVRIRILKALAALK